MAAPYVSHCVARINADLDFLVEQGNLSAEDARVVRSRLPSAAASSPSRVRRTESIASSQVASDPPTSSPARTVPPPPPQKATPLQSSLPPASPSAMPPPKVAKRVLALWPYQSTTPGDLEFGKGEIIEITEEANDHWWQGRASDGRQGLFPSNHVRTLSPSDPQYANIAPPSYSSNGYAGGDSKMALQPYQPGQVQQQPGSQPQQPPKKTLGPMGDRLANSAVGGLGFGAGAAIGSGIVHAIF